jgi:hypothetical protein
MADKNWQTNPKIMAAKTVAKQFNFDAVVIMGFRGGGEGAFEIASYGSSGPICKQAANLVERFARDFESGHTGVMALQEVIEKSK